MATPPSPAQLTLARLIRRYREAAGRIQSELARALGYSNGWLSNVETGQQRPRRDQVIAIEQELGLPAGVLVDVRELIDLDRLPRWFRPWVEEERKATILHWVELSIIPGLLQTPEYARALLGDDEDAVGARLERQEILRRESPPMVRFVLDEAVLLRGRGGKKVMYDQLMHLVNSVTPLISIQVVPSEMSPHSVGAFVLATVEGGRVAYLETAVRGIVTSNREDLDCLSDV